MLPSSPQPTPRSPCDVLRAHKSSSNTQKIPPKHTLSPPPHHPHADSRPKPKKSLNPNSPKPILFVNQRRTPKFPQNIKPHLVTLFSVVLREHPFSEPGLQKIQLSNLPNSHAIDHNFSHLSPSYIKGTTDCLILTATRFNVTHIPIFFFTQDPFSRKLLKLS
jgi:hypothetical protein